MDKVYDFYIAEDLVLLGVRSDCTAWIVFKVLSIFDLATLAALLYVGAIKLLLALFYSYFETEDLEPDLFSVLFFFKIPEGDLN